MRGTGFLFIEVVLSEVPPFLLYEKVKPQDQDIDNYAPERLTYVKSVEKDSCKEDTNKYYEQFFIFAFSSSFVPTHA